MVEVENLVADRRIHGLTTILVVTGFLLVLPEGAAAQDVDPDATKIAAKLMFGFSGEVELDLENSPFDFETDMQSTIGFGGEVEVPIMEYFSVGGLLAFLWWNGDEFDDNDIGRSMVTDFDVVPRLRYPTVVGTTDVVPYVAVPLGITISNANEDWEEEYGNVDTGLGWNIGILFGAQVLFTSMLGLVFEVGYAAHWFSHERDVGSTTYDTDVSFAQLTLNLGILFSL